MDGTQSHYEKLILDAVARLVLNDDQASASDVTKRSCTPRQLLQAVREVFPYAFQKYLGRGESWRELRIASFMMHEGDTPGEELLIRKERKELAEALRGAILLLNHEQVHKNTLKKTSSKIDWDGWSYCPYCWKLAPRRRNKYWKRGRCLEHSDASSPATRRARRLKQRILPEGQGPQAEFLKIKTQVKQEAQGILAPPNNKTVIQLRGDFMLGDLKSPAMQEGYPGDIEPLWEVLTKAKDYALDRGADLSDMLSVIRALDDQEEPSGERRQIHLAFANSPFLAKPFLIRAETWLRLASRERRGGPRPNAGGARPGAGRPRKSQNQ